MGRITIAELFDDLEVDLWGDVFKVREGTRSVATKLAKVQSKLLDLDDDAHDEQAAVYAEILDILLEPVAAENGATKPRTAKAVLQAKWKADELGLDRLAALADQIQFAAAERMRPTSQQEIAG